VKENDIKVVATNRKARHDYHILETYEAGLCLEGTEVKSLRAGKANLKNSFARVKDEELYLMEMHISPYEKTSQFGHDPTRPRKLLMHKKEIKRLMGKTIEKGLTLVPLSLYFKGSHAKVKLALVTGKRKYDKRKAIAEREAKRALERIFREKMK
jgi:SsrA-binding protein